MLVILKQKFIGNFELKAVFLISRKRAYEVRSAARVAF
jgi:hypothetical protein